MKPSERISALLILLTGSVTISFFQLYLAWGAAFAQLSPALAVTETGMWEMLLCMVTTTVLFTMSWATARVVWK